MNITEYTGNRADNLAKLKMPEVEMPLNIKILWTEIVTSENINERIYLGTHSHSFVEVHFVFSGEVSYICDNEMIKLCEGEALIIPTDIKHRYVECGSQLLKASIAFYIDKKDVLFSKNSMKISFNNEVCENLNWILKNSEKKDIFVACMVNGRILEVIYSLLGEIGAELPQNNEIEQDVRLLVAKQYILDNMCGSVKAEDVAKECCLSVKQINRIFKNNLGYSLHEYITATKLNHAQKLLRKQQYSIKEVGYMLGFGSESGFVSFFKRHQGVSPGIYRNQKCLKSETICPE